MQNLVWTHTKLEGEADGTCVCVCRVCAVYVPCVCVKSVRSVCVCVAVELEAGARGPRFAFRVCSVWLFGGGSAGVRQAGDC